MPTHDAYAEMVEQAHEGGHLWTVWSDGLVTNGRTRPTREQLIRDAMSIPECVCSRDARGWAIMSEPTKWSYEKAAASIGNYGLDEPSTEEAAA